MINQMSDQEKMAAFFKAAINACNNPKRQGSFQCPVCMSTAIAMKSDVNGHVMASCPKCKTGFRQ